MCWDEEINGLEATHQTDEASTGLIQASKLFASSNSEFPSSLVTAYALSQPIQTVH